MARPLRIQFPGAFYHVTCRGNAKRPIFLDDLDRHNFIEFLADSLDTYDVTSHSYILMNNHFHLLLETAKANLAEFMRRFNICYTGWFNYHHKLYGHLYQGRYKAMLIDADAYLLELSRYIHLNIVRRRHMKSASHDEKWDALRRYRWSSLHGYLNKSKRVHFVNYDLVLSICGNRNTYRKFILDGLKRGVENPFEKIKHGAILGDNEFVSKVKAKRTLNGSPREQPSLKNITAEKISRDSIIDCVINTLRIEKHQFFKRFGYDTARAITAELLYRYGGLKQHEIGKCFGDIDYSAVSHMRRRLKIKMVKNKKIAEQYQKAETRVRGKLSRFKI